MTRPGDAPPQFVEEQRGAPLLIVVVVAPMVVFAWVLLVVVVVRGEGRGLDLTEADRLGALLSWVLVGLVVPLMLVGLRLRTQVDDDAVRLRFRPFYRRVVPLDEIVQVEAVTYQPLRMFGGWGIRLGRGGRIAYSVRGDEGVALDLLERRNVLIGSGRADELRDAIETAMVARGLPGGGPPWTARSGGPNGGPDREPDGGPGGGQPS